MQGRVILAALVVSFAASTADAQDVVRLRSGKHLCGSILIDEGGKDGFLITLWDTGGTVFVKWSQVPEGELRRLQNKSAAAPTAAVGDIIDGIRVITSSREVVGVLVSESDQTLSIKTAANTSPTTVPKSAILKREDLKIQEGEAYSADEMIAKRSTPDMNAAKCLEVGAFARALKQFAKARDLFAKAAELEPARKAEADALIAALDTLVKEAEAEKALAAVRKLQEETKYVEAIEAAQKFLDSYGATELGKANKELVKKLEAEKKEFDVNRDKILALRVPELWRSVRSSLWSKYADRRYKFGEARGFVDRMDEEVVKVVGEKINCTRDDVEKFWGAREKKEVTVGMNLGSWIYKGGQDGGMDYTGGADDKKDDPVDDFVKRFGGKGKGGDPKKQPELGRKLQTSEEWWAAASSSDHLRWLQCYYGLNSAMVKKVKEEEKDCSQCRGVGTLKAARGTKMVDVVCSRCHGAKKDVAVTFW